MLGRYAVQLAAVLMSTNAAANQPTADVVKIQVSGKPSAYRFSVRIASPDKGCQQYADWWEILAADGELIYRRILAHSHVDENPFTRSSLKSLDIDPDATIFIRAHMNNAGYGGTVWTGTINSGLAAVGAPPALPDLATTGPQPNRCRF